jgi:DHA1 family tetracycline resistance protein-like MFS transporter
VYLDYRFKWSNSSVGLSLALVGICSALVGAVLVRPAVSILGDRNTLLVGIGIGWMGFAIYGIAPTGMLFLCGIPVMSLWSLCGPPAQGLMTHHVGASEQGQLQGAVQCIRGLTALIGPGLFTLVFATAIKPHSPIPLPGAPFLLASVILLAALPLALFVTRRETA